MSNKDLLKQAIAEAKTIREAAIANAKEALEETLTPHLKDMLAAKLQEMEDKEDAEVMDENIYEAEEEEVEAEEGEEGTEEEAEEGEEGEEEELEIEDMSVEDLKDLIRDVVAQETGQGEEDEMETGEEGPQGQGDMVGMEDDSEEIDINELLAELEGMDDEMEEGKKYEMEEGHSYSKGTQQEPGKVNHSYSNKPGSKRNDVSGTKGDGYKVVKEQEIDESQLGDLVKAIAAKTGKSIDAISNFLYGGKSAAPGEMKGFRESTEVQEDLNEALKAVKILRNQLQEVNLLNAKLLYVNKVFKSNNLSEGQKVNVIAAFDKAETVKEVKLVFETVSKNVVAKPAAIKEHRSFASKATGNAQTTAPKEILSEVSEQVARWQKLAGIIKS